MRPQAPGKNTPAANDIRGGNVMWTKKELKEKGKTSFKVTNYWKRPSLGRIDRQPSQEASRGGGAYTGGLRQRFSENQKVAGDVAGPGLIIGEVNDEIADVKEDIEDAKEDIEDAKEDIDDAKEEIKEAAESGDGVLVQY